MILARADWTRLTVASLVAACTIGIVATTQRSEAAAPQVAKAHEQPRVPAVQFVGQHSHVADARFERVADQDAWNTLWGAHTNTEAGFGAGSRHAAPKVDFSRYMVVCVLGGKRTNTDGIVCREVITTDDLVRVRIEDSTYQTMSASGVDHGDATTPYGFFVIERSDARLVVEQGSRSLKSEPLTWKTVHEFAPATERSNATAPTPLLAPAP